jgi:hypothetical protein
MQQPNCDSLMQTVEELADHISDIDRQVGALVAESMDYLNPWQYLVFQGKINHLNREEQKLQAQWFHTMDDLGLCREGRLTGDSFASNPNSSH